VQIFIHAQLFIYGGLFRQIAQRALGRARIIEQIDIINVYLASAGRQVTAQNLHGSGLASAIGAEKTKNIAGLEFETDIVDSTIIAVIANQVPDRDECRHAAVLFSNY
jgi:hypothetical protein